VPAICAREASHKCIKLKTFQDKFKTPSKIRTMQHQIEEHVYGVNTEKLIAKYYEDLNYVNTIETIETIDWFKLSSNCCDVAFEILMDNKDKINWSEFSKNENNLAFQYLLKNPDKIVWDSMKQNRFYVLFGLINLLKELQTTWENKVREQ
jgi:hypothetical protein